MQAARTVPRMRAAWLMAAILLGVPASAEAAWQPARVISASEFPAVAADLPGGAANARGDRLQFAETRTTVSAQALDASGARATMLERAGGELELDDVAAKLGADGT